MHVVQFSSKSVCGVVSYPVWDFIEPMNYICPELHIEIGLVNNVLYKFYEWVEDHIEVATAEEKVYQNQVIIFDVELTKAAKKVQQWKNSGGKQLSEHRKKLSLVQNSLQTKTIGPQRKAAIGSATFTAN